MMKLGGLCDCKRLGNDLWFLCHLFVLTFVSVPLVFLCTLGEVVAKTAVDLARWSGEINLPPDTRERHPAHCRPGNGKAAGQSTVQPSGLLLQMHLL